MDKTTHQLLMALHREARAIPDDELRDSDTPFDGNGVVRGELDATGRQLYTLILRKLETMEALTQEVRQARLSGRLNDEYGKELLRAFATLTNEQMLLNEFLGFRIHRQLNIFKDAGIVIRRGWQVVEVPRGTKPFASVILPNESQEDDETPDGDPNDVN